jgi:ParB-like chromosome segregation protein Spo0J
LTRSKPTKLETSKWRNRITGHGAESPDKLLANPKNWRIHPTAQGEALAGILDEVGWVQSVVVNQRTGFVVDGHLRVALALKSRESAVPVVYVDLSEEDEAKVLASFDAVSQMALADSQALSDLINGIDFGSEALGSFLDSLVDQAELAALVDVPASPDEGEADDRGERLLRDRQTQVKAVLWVEQVRTVERAIRATGEANRGKALVAICDAFLSGQESAGIGPG